MTNLNRKEVAINIEERLSQTKLSKRSKWCIYKVPNDIRELNKDVYTPRVVSIGPFHHDDERLQNAQNYKWEYFKKFVQRSGTKVGYLVTFVEGLELDVRYCYAENIVIDERQLVQIILLDACFIIELFLSGYHGDWSIDDSLAPATRAANILLLDLLLIENQLPFFVFEKLFNWAFPSSESNNLPSFLELTFDYFGYFNIHALNPIDVESVDIRHFTDLLRYFYLQPPSRRQLKRIMETEILDFTASKLQEAGLKFEVNTNRCLLELEFSGCVLKIPKIWVEDCTELLFRNMVAFEQCHCPFEAYITDYVVIFHFLVKTDKDVDVLIQNRIILNCMDDSSAVAKMSSGLSKNVEWRNCNSDYVEHCKKLNEFCKNPCPKLRATLRRDYYNTLRRDYCSTPWQTVGCIAGIVLLFLTLVQTICSVIPVIQNA